MGEESPFDHNGIDEVIHGRIRLGIVAYLSSVESALFSELRDKVGATDGNLGAHIKKLEDAAYVRVNKSFVARRPQTRMMLTAAGRAAWRRWLTRMETLAVASRNQPT